MATSHSTQLMEWVLWLLAKHGPSPSRQLREDGMGNQPSEDWLLWHILKLVDEGKIIAEWKPICEPGQGPGIVWSLAEAK